jgi:hypothetical protein
MAIESGSALDGKWTDVLHQDAAVHLALMASITAATFQGYLKDRFAGPLPYALADLAFVAAAAFWFGRMALRREPIRGPGAVPTILLVVIALPVLYLLHPGAPLIVELAGVRAWAEFPVAALIALSVIRTRGQVRAYIGLIVLLCVITAIYGVVQYRGGVDAAVGVTELARRRHGATVLYSVDQTGTSDFRAFSTFTFPAPFAGMMVFGMLLAAGAAVSRTAPRLLRWACALAFPLLFVGMTVSGTRAALVVLLLGMLLLGWYRGVGLRQLSLVPPILVSLHVGALVTAGRIVERWTTLILQEGTLWSYVTQPLRIAARVLAQAPFGLGLGRTGVGVPFGIVSSQPPGYFVFSDGDIGRAAVEMGIVGLVLLAVIVFGILPTVARATRVLRNTHSEDLGLGIGPLLLATGVLLLIGSPFSSAPHGILWWFLAGAMFKLAMLERGDVSGEP